MGELGEYWREHREYKRKQKEEFAAKTPSLLEELSLNGFEYTSFNHGEHIKISVAGHTVDWWPSTGRWKHGTFTAFKFKRLMKHLSALRGDDLDVPF